MLLAHEARLEKSKKAVLSEPLSVNVAQVPPISPVDSTGSSSAARHPLGGEFHGGRGGRNGGRRGRDGGRSGGRSNVQCQICEKFGHDAHICYHRNSAVVQPPWQVAPARPPSGNQWLNPWHSAQPRPSAYPPPASQLWYPDSGATHHVTNNSENLLDSISLSGSDQVLLGNGQGLSITSVGSAQFHSPYKPHTRLSLNNLLLVPAITKSLISANSEVLLQGKLGKDGLYVFDSSISTAPQ
ncbi:retrovirus-related pol polyprotein from transposon TNT 1-94, partial [Trifolium medium]|nr:retrovirus-related pol polyprotein from transposon TNT 1-94 [Trifolium medium]